MWFSGIDTGLCGKTTPSQNVHDIRMALQFWGIPGGTGLLPDFQLFRPAPLPLK
jgi:hypothetical protein